MKPKPNRAIFDVIAFDADDTLWHNEPLFLQMKREFERLLRRYHSAEWISQKLDETEIRNISHFGYGIKGFTLSMIETAIELTEGRIAGSEIMEIIGFAKEMRKYPVDLLEGVHQAIAELSKTYDLMLITKGDLFEQESKIARSGLSEYFIWIEMVSEKNKRTYETIMKKHAITPERFLMVGNSMKSDVLPVIAAGGGAAYVPYPTTWFFERVIDYDPDQIQFFELENIGVLPELLKELASGQSEA